jgi:hypothetical protein
MIHRKSFLAAVLAVSVVTLGAGFAAAQQAPQVENPAAAAPAAGTAPAAATAPSSGKAMLGLSEIEALLQKQGIRVHELEVRDSVVEAEGRDGNQRKVEVIVDRRSGEILSRRFDD